MGGSANDITAADAAVKNSVWSDCMDYFGNRLLGKKEYSLSKRLDLSSKTKLILQMFLKI